MPGFPKPRTPRLFTVMRNCCTSGNCTTCTKQTPYGKPMRVVQQAHCTEERVKVLLDGWREYQPEAIAE